VSNQNTNNLNLSGLPRQLVSLGLLSEEDAGEALATAESEKKDFLTIAVKNYDLNPTKIAQQIGAEFGLPIFDVSAISPESLPQEFLSEDMLSSVNAVPIAQRGSRLFVAISDPTNSEALDKYKFSSGLGVEAVLVEEDKLEKLRQSALEAGEDLSEGLDESFDIEVEGGDDAAAMAEDDGSEVDETPIVRFVRKLRTHRSKWLCD